MEKFDRLKLLYKEPPQVMENTKKQAAPSVKAKKTVQKTHAEWTFGFDTSTVLPPDTQSDPTTPEAQLARLKKRISKNGYTLLCHTCF